MDQIISSVVMIVTMTDDFSVALELCDGVANVCGGTLTSDEMDDDGDGYVECLIDFVGWQGDPGSYW